MMTYESAIKMAVRDLARDRALGFLRPRVIEESDYIFRDLRLIIPTKVGTNYHVTRLYLFGTSSIN